MSLDTLQHQLKLIFQFSCFLAFSIFSSFGVKLTNVCVCVGKYLLVTLQSKNICLRFFSPSIALLDPGLQSYNRLHSWSQWQSICYSSNTFLEQQFCHPFMHLNILIIGLFMICILFNLCSMVIYCTCNYIDLYNHTITFSQCLSVSFLQLIHNKVPYFSS